MKRLIIGALLAVACAAGSASAQTANAPGQEEMKPANWLFVQVADQVEVTDKTITLKGVAPQVLMFTDRPERMTGDTTTAGFVKLWGEGKDSFQKDPPNATLSVTVGGKPSVTAIELTDPVLSGDTLTFTYKLLGDEKPASGTNASLFIDWWYGRGPYWRGGGCWRGPWGHLHCRW